MAGCISNFGLSAPQNLQSQFHPMFSVNIRTRTICSAQVPPDYDLRCRNSITAFARIPHAASRISVSRGFPAGLGIGYRQHTIQKKKKKGGFLVSASNENSEPTAIELYGQIERLITNTARKSQDAWGATANWEEIEGAWVLRPNKTNPIAVIHFVGGIFVGAAPQITYRLFLERLSMRGFLVVATPFASGFDHLRIADEVQFKFDRSFRFLQRDEQDLPTFGVGHSLGTVIHLLIGARYAVQRTGNVFMAFNNKEASLAIPLFSPVIVPMAQSFGPVLAQLTSSPTIRRGAEIALKQLEILSPPLLKQILPLVEQLPPLYFDLVNGREDFVPRPEETRRLIKSYYGVSRNLLLKFKDDTIDDTPVLAQILSFESAVSSSLDMSVRTLPGDHGLPLQQVFPEVPSAMADAVTRGGEILANLATGTPWETVAKDVGISIGTDTRARSLREQIIQDIDKLVDEITIWVISSRKMLL